MKLCFIGINEALTKQSFVDDVIGRKDMQIITSY